MPVISPGATEAPFVSRAVADLAAQVAHDLNNHLATMLGKAELALMLDDPGRFRPTIGEILGAGQPARGLVADLQRVLSWSRLLAERVPLSEVLATIVRLTLRRAERLGIELGACPGPEPILCEEPARVTLLVWRLVCAAIDENSAEDASWTIASRAVPGGYQIILEASGLRWSEQARALARGVEVRAGTARTGFEDLVDGAAESGARIVLDEGGATLTL